MILHFLPLPVKNSKVKLEYRFFHADQHSGNVWIDNNGNRIYLDFGIMGILSESDRKIALQLLFSMYMKNFKKFVDIQIEAKWISSEIDRQLLISRYVQMDNQLATFTLGESLQSLIHIGEDFDIDVPVQFTLLIKTLLVSEGTARTLCPNLDFKKVGADVFVKHFKCRR